MKANNPRSHTKVVNGQIIELLTCQRCNHSWYPRPSAATKTTKLPKICPRCKSQLWQTARKTPPAVHFTLILTYKVAPSDEQRAKAEKVLDEARKRLNAIFEVKE